MSASAHRHDRSTRKRWQATSAIPLWTQSDLRRGSRRQADLNQSLYRTVLRRSVSRRLTPERLWLGIGLTVIGCSPGRHGAGVASYRLALMLAEG